MANDVITPKYTVFDLGYEKCLAKSDSFYDDQGANADKVTDSVPSILIGGGGLIGNITMVDGFMQSSNYVAGSTGWKLTETTAYLPSIDLSGYLLATGGIYKTAATGSRVEIFPDANTGIIAYDDGGDTVFTVLVGGTDQGDVIIGSAAKYAKWDKSAATFTINGAAVTSSVITSVASGSDFSVLHWQETMVFSATDYDTVAWAAGAITLSDGTTYNIDAGNTGNMAARTFIYFDKAVSSTVLQITTTAATANGANKILIAVAQNNADNTSKATFQAFGGAGGQMVTVDMIAANSASVNEFISNTAQIKDAIITNAKIASLDVGKLTSGLVVSKAITLSFTEGAGDCYIAAGKTDFDHDETGFIFGIDDSDSNKAKLLIGNSTKYLNWDGNDLSTTNLSILNMFTSGEQILANEVCFIIPANRTLIRAYKQNDGGQFDFGTPVDIFSHRYPKWSSRYLTGANQIEIKYLSLYLSKYSSGGYPLPTDSVRISLQTDNNGVPSGTVIGEFVFEKAAADIAETLTEYNFAVTTPSVIAANTYFWIVVERTGDISKYSAYSSGTGNLAAKSLGISGGAQGSKYWDGDSWEFPSNPNVASKQIAMSLSFNAIAGYAYRASAYDANNYDNMVFIAYENVAKFVNFRLNFSKIISNFTGLTLGSEYYLANEPGTIATSAGNVEKKIGKAFSATGLIIY